MINRTLTVQKVPNESLALLDCAVVNPEDFVSHLILIVKKSSDRYLLSCRSDSSVSRGNIGIAVNQRGWIECSLGDKLEVKYISSEGEPKIPAIKSILFEVKHLKKSISNSAPYNTDALSERVFEIAEGHPFTVNQPLLIEFTGSNLSLIVKSVEPVGILHRINGNESSDAIVKFFASPDSQVKLQSGLRTENSVNVMLQSSFKFEDMGIGGLGDEFSTLFRRVFSSRLVPSDMARQLGIQHVRGVLLYGPPGTGKTLIARQIGRMLNAVEPKIVNGPEILNRYVGQSEENIRTLFKDAEIDWKNNGPSGTANLHIIIFDELDAICRQRGSARSDSGVGDSVVNQLLSKMDGVNQLENVVVIGMTNRLELIDEALLRPGRFEVHIKIGLPDEPGRLQILSIHTAAMRAAGRLAMDVSLQDLGAISRNYSGAELCGLIRAATSHAISRHIKGGTMASLDQKSFQSVQVSREDFMQALLEVRPMNGVDEERFGSCSPYGYISWSSAFEELITECSLAVKQIQMGKTSLYTVLLYGIWIFLFKE